MKKLIMQERKEEHSSLQASIAGGALMGVVSAGMRFAGFEYSHSLSGATMQIGGIVVYLLPYRLPCLGLLAC